MGTTTSSYGFVYNTYYNKYMIPWLRENAPLSQMGEKVGIPGHSTKTITFSRLDKSTPATEITEGVQPAFDGLTKSTVSATLKWYGKGIESTDQVTLTVEDNVLRDMQEMALYACARKLESLVITTLYTTTSQWSSHDASDHDVDFGFDGSTFTQVDVAVDAEAFRACYAKFKENLVRPVIPKLMGSDKVGSSALRASYLCIAPTSMAAFFLGLTGFVEVQEYASDKTYIYPDEIGYIEGFRVILNDNMTYASTAAGSGDKVAYPLILMGMLDGNKWPFAQVDLDEMGVQNWTYPMGSGDDYFHQSTKVVAKFAHASVVTADEAVVVLYTLLA